METTCELLSRAAERAEADPFFLAHALAAYRRRHGLTDEQLAARLGCSVGLLPRLGLCRRPATPAEVERVAERFGIAPAALAGAAGPAGGSAQNAPRRATGRF